MSIEFLADFLAGRGDRPSRRSIGSQVVILTCHAMLKSRNVIVGSILTMTSSGVFVGGEPSVGSEANP